jgi:hypothetical protein
MLLVLGGIAFSLCASACKKEAEPQALPVPTVAATPESPPTAATAAETAPVAATPPPPPKAIAPVAPASIDGCCAALSAVAKSGRGAQAKSKSATAAKICSGVAKLVKEGKTTRPSALTTVRAQLGGVDVPSECH